MPNRRIDAMSREARRMIRSMHVTAELIREEQPKAALVYLERSIERAEAVLEKAYGAKPCTDTEWQERLDDVAPKATDPVAVSAA